jgi:dihydrofolate reductase
MRKLIVCNIISLDGYYEGPGNNVMDVFAYRHAYPKDESFDSYNATRLRTADMLLLGRTMYEQARGYWPPLADDPNAPASERQTSRLLNAIDKVVISDSLTLKPADPWQNSTRIVSRANARKQIAEFKRQSGKDILVFGSRTLWNNLLTNGLVDELHFIIAPVALGAGTPVFNRRPDVSLRLIGIRTWKGSGNVLARYEVRR